jgi:hypothetical protein
LPNAGQRRRQGAAIPGPPSSPDAPQDDDFRRFCRRAWARLIRKVYLMDPLTCPKCGGRLRKPEDYEKLAQQIIDLKRMLTVFVHRLSAES